MNLIIDAGNTFVKTAVFQANELIQKQTFPSEKFSEYFEKIISSFPSLESCIISSVGKGEEKIAAEVGRYLKVTRLDRALSLPFKNEYGTPQTLGKDRIGLIAAAVQQYPGKNVLVIDAGTCITYDIKTAKELYLGGAISPGLQMRFSSLHKFTANLPLVKPKPEPALIGSSTETSILSGIINGIELELSGFIDRYNAQFEDLTVIFTGGDSQILSIPLKNSIFANSNFLLEGLNFILEFNKTQ